MEKNEIIGAIIKPAYNEAQSLEFIKQAEAHGFNHQQSAFLLNLLPYLSPEISQLMINTILPIQRKT